MTVKNMFRVVLIVGTIVSLFFVPWSYLFTALRPLPNDIQKEVDYFAEKRFDGVIVAVKTETDEFIYTAGLHNKATNEEAYPEAIFKIASISKLYVATATSMLIDEGLLSRDDLLSDLLPEYKDSVTNAKEITLAQLVNHTSGIKNFIFVEGFPGDEPILNNTDMMKFVVNQEASFKPGEKYEYSNSNYVLLGLILDSVLGYDHHRYIEKNIFEPLGLMDTYNLMSDVNDKDRIMTGYDKNFEEDLNKEMDHTASSGSMLATASDVALFIEALNKGYLLKRSAQEIYSSLYVYSHTGLVPGYQSIARYDRELDVTFVIFTSTSGGYSWNLIDNLYSRVRKIYAKNQ